MLTVGLMLAGGFVGFLGGIWYAEATDKSDFPMTGLFSIPAGVALGVFAGGVAGALV